MPGVLNILQAKFIKSSAEHQQPGTLTFVNGRNNAASVRVGGEARRRGRRRGVDGRLVPKGGKGRRRRGFHRTQSR